MHAIAPQRGDRLVEIGPGLGALTAPLLTRVDVLEVIELDRDLAARLRLQAGAGGVGSSGSESIGPGSIGPGSSGPGSSGPGSNGTARAGLRVHEADALRFDFAALAGNGPIRVVGNLPYNISTPLIFHLLSFGGRIRDMHFMLQREVVERLAAAPGGRDYGRLSVMAQYHCAVAPLFLVPPGAFEPPPKVESAIVRLLPHARPPVEVGDAAVFAELVALAFGQRRKTLRNNLKGRLDAAAIEACGIDPRRRAETLALVDFAALARALAAVRQPGIG